METLAVVDESYEDAHDDSDVRVDADGAVGPFYAALEGAGAEAGADAGAEAGAEAGAGAETGACAEAGADTYGAANTYGAADTYGGAGAGAGADGKATSLCGGNSASGAGGAGRLAQRMYAALCVVAHDAWSEDYVNWADALLDTTERLQRTRPAGDGDGGVGDTLPPADVRESVEVILRDFQGSRAFDPRCRRHRELQDALQAMRLEAARESTMGDAKGSGQECAHARGQAKVKRGEQAGGMSAVTKTTAEATQPRDMAVAGAPVPARATTPARAAPAPGEPELARTRANSGRRARGQSAHPGASDDEASAVRASAVKASAVKAPLVVRRGRRVHEGRRPDVRSAYTRYLEDVVRSTCRWGILLSQRGLLKMALREEFATDAACFESILAARTMRRDQAEAHVRFRSGGGAIVASVKGFEVRVLEGSRAGGVDEYLVQGPADLPSFRQFQELVDDLARKRVYFSFGADVPCRRCAAPAPSPDSPSLSDDDFEESGLGTTTATSQDRGDDD